MKAHYLEQEPETAYTLTCDDCSPQFLHAVDVTPRSVVTLKERRPSPWCSHCAWCGLLLLQPEEGVKCVMHEGPCPPYSSYLTVQAWRIQRFLAGCDIALTKEGWRRVALEIRVAGSKGVDLKWVGALLVQGDEFTRRIEP